MSSKTLIHSHSNSTDILPLVLTLMQRMNIVYDTHRGNNLECDKVATLPRTPCSPKRLECGPNGDGACSYGDADNDDDLSEPLLLLHEELGHQRQIPPDDEFISTEDEMSCQGQGYVWEVICVLCGIGVSSVSAPGGSAGCKFPCLAGTGLPQTEPPFCPSGCLAPPLFLQVLQAANRWLNICALSESRGMLG